MNHLSCTRVGKNSVALRTSPCTNDDTQTSSTNSGQTINTKSRKWLNKQRKQLPDNIKMSVGHSLHHHCLYLYILTPLTLIFCFLLFSCLSTFFLDIKETFLSHINQINTMVYTPMCHHWNHTPHWLHPLTRHYHNLSILLSLPTPLQDTNHYYYLPWIN